MDFKTRLSALIKDMGITQKELAKMTGVTEAAISRYINGSRLPNMTALLLLKKGLGCTWEQLVGE